MTSWALLYLLREKAVLAVFIIIVACQTGLRNLFCCAGQVYVIRQSVTSWSLLYLIREKAVPAAAAAWRVSGLELGGLLGSLTAGALSDSLIRRNANNPAVGTVGLRVKVRGTALDSKRSKGQP